MALTKQEIYERHKERYHSDPEYRERISKQKAAYYQRRKNDPDFQKRTKEYNKKNASYFNKKTKEYNAANPFHYAFRRLRMRARRQGLPFNLDADYLSSIWTGQCAIFGIPLCLPYSTDRQVDNKATIDKVIPEKGYVKGNVHWVSNRANIIKSYGTISEHKQIVEYMSAYSGGEPNAIN